MFFGVLYSMNQNTCELCGKPNKYDKYDRKHCPSCNTKIRRIRLKMKLVEMFGGKCQRCGFDKHIAALEFHHQDPSQKEFQLAAGGTTSWEKLKEEAKKCEMICSNCHQIEHASKQSDKFDEALKNYKGRMLLI